MPLIRRTVKGDDVRLFCLPPAEPHFARRWREFVESDAVLGLDVETTAIDEDMGTFDPSMRLRTVQFGSPTQGWMLDAHGPWRGRIRRLLESSAHRFVSHTNYDPLWVRREFDIDLGADDRSLDTFPMAALLRPGPMRPKDLKTLSDLYIDTQLSEAEEELSARFKELALLDPTTKGKRVGRHLKAWGFTNIPIDDEVFARYGGLDAVYVRRLLDLLAAELKAKGMARLSKREQRIERIMTATQVRGHRLDQEFTRARFAEVDETYRAAKERVETTCGCVSGSPKVADWLQGQGIEFAERTPTGRPKLGKDTLPYLAELHAGNGAAGQVIADLLSLSEGKNLRTNLGICLRAADADGFVHPRILTQQAVTGRMSIQRPAMQTFKKGPLRGCFIAREGHVFVGADYDSQEIRLAAAFSGDEALNRVVADGLSQHEMTALLVFGEDWRADPINYRKAKVLNFAQQYGAGPKTIAAQLGIGVGEAKKLWAAWNKAYAGLVAWTKEMGRYDSVTNPWDRLIPADRFRPYANGNYAVQSSGRDALGDALVALDHSGWGGTIWLPIHDEIILEVPEGRAQRATKILEESMHVWVGDVELTATAEIIGRRWSGGE